MPTGQRRISACLFRTAELVLPRRRPQRAANRGGNASRGANGTSGRGTNAANYLIRRLKRGQIFGAWRVSIRPRRRHRRWNLQDTIDAGADSQTTAEVDGGRARDRQSGNRAVVGLSPTPSSGAGQTVLVALRTPSQPVSSHRHVGAGSVVPPVQPVYASFRTFNDGVTALRMVHRWITLPETPVTAGPAPAPHVVESLGFHEHV